MRDLITLWELLYNKTEAYFNTGSQEGLCILCNILLCIGVITRSEFDILREDLKKRLKSVPEDAFGYHWPLTRSGMLERMDFCRNAIKDLKSNKE